MALVEASGTEQWREAFITELNNTYSLVSSYFENCVLTGSAAVAFLSMKSNSPFLHDLSKPNDFDFLVVSHNTTVKPENIGSYSIQSFQSVTTKSVSYIGNSGKLDIMSIPKLTVYKIDGISVVIPTDLLQTYCYEKRNGDNVKILALQWIVESNFFSKETSSKLEIEKRKAPLNRQFCAKVLNFGNCDADDEDEEDDESEDNDYTPNRLCFGYDSD